MNKYFFFLLAVCLLLICGCKEKKVTMEDNGRTIHLKLNEVLQVELPGFDGPDSCWRKVEFNNSVLISVGKASFVMSEKNYFLGEKGMYSARFLAIGPGTSRFYLEYGNKNDPKEPPLKTFEIEVVVGKE